MKKKITEAELRARVNGLKKYMALLEEFTPNAADQKNIQTWVNAVKGGRKTIDDVPEVYKPFVQKEVPPAPVTPPAEEKKDAPPVVTPPAEEKKDAPPVVTPPAEEKKDAPPTETPPEEKKDTPPVKKQWNPGVLGMGVAGSEVKELQRKLIAAGLLPQGADDSKFGTNTRDAVIKLQTALGVKPDGAVGPKTKAALDAKYQELTKQPNAEVKQAEVNPAEVNPAEVNPAEVKPDDDDPDVAYANSQKQAELIKRGEENARYKSLQDRLKGVDPSQYITKTGNMQKPWTELKDGDVDYDDRGVKQVYRKGADGGPGNWQASWGGDSKAGSWHDEPGFGLVGPSANSPEGQKYVQARQQRMLTPDEAALLAKRQPAPAQSQNPTQGPVPVGNTKYSGETPEQNAARLADANKRAEADGTKARIQQDYKDQQASGMYAQEPKSNNSGLVPVPGDQTGAYQDPKTGTISYPNGYKSESVSFKTEESLARIIQLARGR
jgi:hypothetical protein